MADVDANFKEILNHLNGALMLSLEARKEASPAPIFPCAYQSNPRRERSKWQN
jgi:hypothetical protein